MNYILSAVSTFLRIVSFRLVYRLMAETYYKWVIRVAKEYLLIY